jgi:hypothetical protein
VVSRRRDSNRTNNPCGYQATSVHNLRFKMIDAGEGARACEFEGKSAAILPSLSASSTAFK